MTHAGYRSTEPSPRPASLPLITRGTHSGRQEGHLRRSTARVGSPPRIAWVGCFGSIVACASAPDTAERRPAVERRDSADIEIVMNHRPAWPASANWRVTADPLVHIRGSDGSAEAVLLDPASIDVDSQGRIIVGDGDQAGWHAVLVFDSTGQFLFRAGREGPGPGEFGQLWWASTYRGDSIVAFDMADDKVAVFDPQGGFVREVRTPAVPVDPPPAGTNMFTNGIDAAFGDGHFLAYPIGILDITDGPGPAWYRHPLLRLRPDGETWDSLGQFEIDQRYWTGSTQETLWFAPVAVVAAGWDHFYFGTGDEFEVRRYNAMGNVTRIIRRQHTPRPVTDRLVDALRDWFLDRMRASRHVGNHEVARVERDFAAGYFADELPAYSGMLLDTESNLWVEEWTRSYPGASSFLDGPVVWSVFDSTGAWRSNVQMPSGFMLHKVTGTRALGFVVGEGDVEEILVFGIEKPEQ